MHIVKKLSYKTDHIPQIRNQSENYDNPQKPENLRLTPVIII